MGSAAEVAAAVAARGLAREPAAPKGLATALQPRKRPCRATGQLRSPSLAKTAVPRPSTPFPEAGAPAQNIKLHSIEGFGRSSATASIVPGLNLRAIGEACCSPATAAGARPTPSSDFPRPPQKLANA